LIPIYVVFPGQIKNVIDLYKSIISKIDIALITKFTDKDISEAFNEVSNTSWCDFLKNGLNVIKYGDQNTKAVIKSWLAGEKVHLNTLKVFDIARRIESTEDCVEVLSCLFKVIILLNKKKSILLMIDEFQEIGRLAPAKINDLNGFIHKLFDLNPNKLHLFLSFTTGDKATVRSLLGEALQNRISNILSIPEMDFKEAYEFMENLIKINSESSEKPDIYPFTKKALESIVNFVLESDERFLIPRELIKVADLVLGEADSLIEDGEIQKIDAALVKSSIDNNKDALE
jgi:hypothetical protein